MFKKILFGLLLMGMGNAWANISIFPYNIDFEAESNKRVKSIRVINTSQETQTYRVSFVNFEQGENGELKEITDKKGLYADEYLNWSPRQFTLKPNEVQTINVARKSMAQAPDGEFVSHLKIREVAMGTPKATNQKAEEDTLSMQLKALLAVTLPVTITKGKDLHHTTTVESYKISQDGNMNITLKRSGNLSSRVNIIVTNDKGKEIGRINNAKIYLSTDKLNLKFALDKSQMTKAMKLKLEDARTGKNISTQAISY